MKNSKDDDATVSVSKIFFLVISLFGLVPSIYQTIKGKQTVTQFINNNRDFTLFQLGLTLIATEISLNAVNYSLKECFSRGLNGFLPGFIGITAWCLIMQLLIPRLNLFFTKRYLGEVIETLAGKSTLFIINIIIFIGAILLCVGQFKSGMNSAYFLTDTQKLIFLWGFGLFIAFYVVRGGITSVVNSDVIQLFLAMLSIIFIATITCCYIQSEQFVANTTLTKVILDDIKSIKFDSRSFNIFILMLIPSFSPVYISRFFLAKNKEDLKSAFKWLNIGYLILLTSLYLIARIIFIMYPDILVLDIEHTLKAINFVDRAILIVIFLALFMIAVTTIDSLLQFITVEVATMITKNEKTLSKLFKIIPFILMFIICILAQHNDKLIDTMYIYNLAQMFFLPVVTPIIMFYCITNLRFTSPALPLIGILIGSLTTLFIYFNDLISAYLNPGIVGGLANLLVLLICKNLVKHEHVG